MLHIVGIIFLILGSILLAILGLLILSVGIVVFVPIRYWADAESQGKWEDTVFHIRFSWLLHLVSGQASFEEGRFQGKIRILWIGKKSGEKRPEGKSKNHSSKEKKTKKHNENFVEKIKSLIRGKEDIKEFFQDEVHRAGWQRVKLESGRLFRYLKPKRFHLKLHYGFEDVYLTGKVLAFLSVLYPFYGEEIQIIPDFEQPVLEGNAQVKGRVYGVWLLILLWNLCRDRNVRTTYRHIKNRNTRK